MYNDFKEGDKVLYLPLQQIATITYVSDSKPTKDYKVLLIIFDGDTEEILTNSDYIKKIDIENNSPKPPLGLMPIFVYHEQRIKEITEAMIRYAKVNYIIPSEWIEEYNNLVKGLKE